MIAASRASDSIGEPGLFEEMNASASLPSEYVLTPSTNSKPACSKSIRCSRADLPNGFDCSSVVLLKQQGHRDFC